MGAAGWDAGRICARGKQTGDRFCEPRQGLCLVQNCDGSQRNSRDAKTYCGRDIASPGRFAGETGERTMWLPAPLYRNAPYYWMLTGIALVVVGTVGIQNVDFVIGLICLCCGSKKIRKRGRSESCKKNMALRTGLLERVHRALPPVLPRTHGIASSRRVSRGRCHGPRSRPDLRTELPARRFVELS